jgi:LysR family transcriptional regulator, low CO2-responsive transcriptional regulator
MSEGEQASRIQSDLSVHQLNLFRTVANHLSYTKAAEKLYLSQPAVSQQIKALEQALGLRLFERKGRGIMLTRAGEVLLMHAERLLAQLAQTAPVVEEIHDLQRGSVVIGASTSAGTYVVPALLGAFHARYPHLRVTLTVVTRRTIEEYLLAHRVDLAVISFVEQHERFTLEFLQQYQLVIVAPYAHPLAKRKRLTLHDLQRETFLLREHGADIRLETEQLFAAAGVHLRTNLEFGSIEAIKEGVIAGLGIALLSYESVTYEIANKELTILNVQGFPLQRQWYVVHLKGGRLSLAATALREFLLRGRNAVDAQ